MRMIVNDSDDYEIRNKRKMMSKMGEKNEDGER